MSSIIDMKNLEVNMLSKNGIIHVIRGVNLSIKKGEIHGIVGESGSGKTITAKSILRLHDSKKTEYFGNIFLMEMLIFCN